MVNMENIKVNASTLEDKNNREKQPLDRKIEEIHLLDLESEKNIKKMEALSEEYSKKVSILKKSVDEIEEILSE